MNSPTLYRARYVLPITTAPIEDGALLVTNGKVLAVGTYKELKQSNPRVDVVDFTESILLPTFVNAHTHLELTDFPGWADAAGEPDPPADFVDWILWLVRVKRTVSEEQIKKSLANGLKLSLEAGTGLVGDILTTLGAVTAYKSSPVSGRAFGEVLGHDLTMVRERLEVIVKLSAQQKTGNFDFGLSPHSSYTLSRDVMQEVFAFAQQEGLQSCIHLAESKEESCFLTDASGPVAEMLYDAAQWQTTTSLSEGLSPVQTLCRGGRLKGGDLVVHGVEVDKDDVGLLKEKGCSVVLCPRSNAAIGGGRAPVEEYLAAGVNLAIGTDSLASSPSLSIWHELAFAREWFEGMATPRQWLEIATVGGAKALKQDSRYVPLEGGSEASFQVVSLAERPRLSELEEALCSAGPRVQVSHLYLNGKNRLPNS